MARRKTKIDRAAEIQLKRIAICKSRIVALEYAVRGVDWRRKNGPSFEKAHAALSTELYRNLNDAYGSLLLVAGLASPEIERKARRSAYQHYLHERANIMCYLTLHGDVPGCWSESEEKEFRAEIEKTKKGQS